MRPRPRLDVRHWIEGRAVILKVEAGDLGGTDTGTDSIRIVVNAGLLDDGSEEVWESEETPWQWDASIREAWGTAEYARVRRRAAALYAEHDLGDGNIPTCAELGMHGAAHGNLLDELYEVALRQLVPGLLALGDQGVAVSWCTPLGAVSIVDQVSTCFKMPFTTSLHIYTVRRAFQPLALALLRDFGMEREWVALDPGLRRQLALGHGERDGDVSTFFTPERLAACL